MDQLIKSALEHLPNFVIVNRAGYIVYLNEVYAKLLGTTSKKAIGKRVANVIPNTRLITVMENEQEEIGSVMKLYDHTKQEDIHVVCNRIPLVDNGKVIGAVAVTTATNMDDIKKLSQEIEHIRAERQSYLQEINDLRDNRSPLSRVIGTSAGIIQAKRIVDEYAESNLA